MEKILLLIIDAQYDFCNKNGSLFVPGAVEDMQHLTSFIKNNANTIDNIVLSQDAHQVVDISHPYFWKNKDGKRPEPYTAISAESVEQGEWIPMTNKDWAVTYLKELYKQGEFSHVIWPEHCIEGSLGASIVENVMDEVKNWSRLQNKLYTIIPKGQNPLTEHFGIIRANVPLENDQNTQENKSLINLLGKYSKICIAGEAQSHCVANTVKQILKYPDIASKLVVMKNCMSPVPGFESIADCIYNQLNPNQFIEC